MRIIAVILATALAPAATRAADVHPDPGFGVGGVVEIAWPAGSARANAVGVDRAGRILVGGSAAGVYGDADFALFRLLPDGRLDTSYAADSGGVRLIDFNLAGIGGNSDDVINDLVVRDDGFVIGVGEAHFGFAGVNSQAALVRLDAHGALDPGFGRDGRAHFSFSTFANIDSGLRLAVDAADRLLVGSRVAQFSAGGNLTLEWLVGVARLTPQGALDPTFFDGGRYTTPFWADPDVPPPQRHSTFNVPLALALDASARILVAGVVQGPIPTDGAVHRAPPDGGWDSGFGRAGRIQLGLDEAEASALQPLPDGRLLVAGGHASGAGYALFLARLGEDGSRDPAFGDNGLASLPLAQGYPEPSLIVPTREGGWLVAGTLARNPDLGGDVVLARFDAQGQPDTGFGEQGIMVIAPDDGRAFNAWRVAWQADGKLVVAGSRANSDTDPTVHFAVMRIVVDEFVFADGFDAR